MTLEDRVIRCVRFLWRWMMILLFVGAVDGHVVSQLFVEAKELPKGWVLEVQFDAGYARPEWREDFSKPQPDREWLMGLSKEEQWELHELASAYLGEVLGLKDLNVGYRYPDWPSNPPDYPVLRNGGAYFRIELYIDESHFELGLSREAVPTFVIHRDGKFDSLKPGRVVVFGEKAKDGVSMERHALSEGFLHVFPYGLDHTLFILAIFFHARRWRPLLWQSLAFTVAHTITLGLTIGGVITPPSQWVEPLIALSIGALALENFFVREKVGKKRLGLVFFFGLIHGMGFAGALAGTFGGDDFYGRLILTNLGVELAQVTILAVAWVLTIHFNPCLEKIANLILIVASLIWFVGYFV